VDQTKQLNPSGTVTVGLHHSESIWDSTDHLPRFHVNGS